MSGSMMVGGDGIGLLLIGFERENPILKCVWFSHRHQRCTHALGLPVHAGHALLCPVVVHTDYTAKLPQAQGLGIVDEPVQRAAFVTVCICGAGHVPAIPLPPTGGIIQGRLKGRRLLISGVGSCLKRLQIVHDEGASDDSSSTANGSNGWREDRLLAGRWRVWYACLGGGRK